MVDAQFQEFTTALKEGRDPDYLSAILSHLDLKQPLKEQTKRTTPHPSSNQIDQPKN